MIGACKLCLPTVVLQISSIFVIACHCCSGTKGHQTVVSAAMASIFTMGFEEAEVRRALAQAGGDENIAINILLDPGAAAPPSRADSHSRTASPAAASRFFVVRNEFVESRNEAHVYVHGLVPGLPRHAPSGGMIDGSGMWLGKLELGEALGCSLCSRVTFTCLSGEPAIVERLDRLGGKAFARMLRHYKGCTCFFESKDLIDMSFDEIYIGREVRPYPNCHHNLHVTHFCNMFLLFRPKTLKFNSSTMIVLLYTASLRSQKVGLLERFRNQLWLQVASLYRAGFDDLFFWAMISSAIG